MWKEIQTVVTRVVSVYAAWLARIASPFRPLRAKLSYS